MANELFDAIKAGNADDVTRLARENPALLRARDASGASPILVAIYHRKPDIANALAVLTTLDLFEASALGRVDRIRQILHEHPALVSTYAPDGFTPVALSAFFGHLDAGRALIAAGADVNAAARNAFKVTALHAAVAGGNIEIIRAVLAAGADPNASQQGGFRPIHEAAANAKRELAELLIAHGADPRLPNDAGKSAGDLAREKGHTEFAAFLESAGHQRPR
jgi:ankyrin repeat protein